jgi:hypothetical protein
MPAELQSNDRTRTSGRTFSQRGSALLLALILTLQSGCAMFHHRHAPAKPVVYEAPATLFQTSLGRVAILSSAQVPDMEFHGLARSKGEGAVKNVMNNSGILLGCGLAFMVLSGIIGGYLGAVCLVPIPFMAVSGAVKAPARDEVVNSEAALTTALDAEVIRENLREEIIADAQAKGIDVVEIPPEAARTAMQTRDYRPLTSLGVDSVLQADIYLGFAIRTGHFSASDVPPARIVLGDSSDEFNPPLQLMMATDVQVINASENAIVFSDTYSYRGKELTFTEWGANHAERLVETLKSSDEDVGQNATDRIRMLYPFPFRMAQGDLGSCGLAPAYPIDGARVADLHPVLYWQEFPRDSDIAAAPEEMKRIKNVTYDLILATGETREPLDVVYRREGLKEPFNKVDMELQPGTRYFWSARARFELDGRERVTEWGTQCPFQQQLVIGARLYRFYTPKPDLSALQIRNGTADVW